MLKQKDGDCCGGQRASYDTPERLCNGNLGALRLSLRGYAFARGCWSQSQERSPVMVDDFGTADMAKLNSNRKLPISYVLLI